MTPRLDVTTGAPVPSAGAREVRAYRRAMARLEDAQCVLEDLLEAGVIPRNYATQDAVDDITRARRTLARNTRL